MWHSTYSSIESLLPAIIFVNAQAGGGRGASAARAVEDCFRKASSPANLIAASSAEDLEQRVTEAIDRGAKLLVAVGGDGTFQSVVNAAFGRDVVLAVVPGGGGNDFAKALGLSRDAATSATAILRGQPRCVDVARARTSDGRERLYVGGGGLGIDAEAARHAAGTLRFLRGRKRYMAGALWALCRYQAMQVRVEFPGSEMPAIDKQVLLAAVLNTPSYGAGVRLAPDASVEDGLLDVAVVENVSVLSALRWLPQLLQTGDLPAEKIERRQVRKIRLSADRSAVFHGDGEILGLAPVDIEVVPRAIRVLAP